MKKSATIQKQKQALQAKLAALAEKERKATAKEKKEAALAHKKYVEKCKDALALILIQHHTDGFVDLDIENLKEVVTRILTTPGKKEKTNVAEFEPV